MSVWTIKARTTAAAGDVDKDLDIGIDVEVNVWCDDEYEAEGKADVDDCEEGIDRDGDEGATEVDGGEPVF